jgi:hypothetical protein
MLSRTEMIRQRRQIVRRIRETVALRRLAQSAEKESRSADQPAD